MKKRLRCTTQTLLDVYKAVDFTEATAMSRHNPFTPALQPQLRDCLTAVVSPDTLNIMTTNGIGGLIRLIVVVAMRIVEGLSPRDECENVVFQSIQSGTLVDTFSWMPPSWVVPRTTPAVSHLVSVVVPIEENTPQNILSRVEPFLGIAHRSLDVFNAINNALTTLHSLKNTPLSNNIMPVNFT